LRSAAARNKPNRYFGLTEDRFADGREAHIHRQGDFTPSATGPSLDFGNGYFRHIPKPLADRLRKTKAARMGNDLGSASNSAQTRVGDKVIRKRALDNHDPDALISLELSAEFVEFLRQNFIQKIYRRVIDTDECNSRIKPKPETIVVRISHERGSIFGMICVPDERRVLLMPADCDLNRMRRKSVEHLVDLCVILNTHGHPAVPGTPSARLAVFVNIFILFPPPNPNRAQPTITSLFSDFSNYRVS
jgi:hypothetical protein